MAWRMTQVLTIAIAVMLLWLLAGCADDDQHQTGSQQEEGQKQCGMTTARGSTHQLQTRQEEGKLVFQLPLDRNPALYAIWTMNANGSGLKQLTYPRDDYPEGNLKDTDVSTDPARSPDLKKIAFTMIASEYASTESAEAASPPSSGGPSPKLVSHVCVMDADGSDQVTLVDRVGAAPDWSPDGKKIVFSSGIPKLVAECDLYVANADGSGTPRALTTEPGCESNPAWSPDGTKIAFTRERDSNLDIYVINACCKEGHTNQPQRLTADPLRDTDPAWSPDGTKIAFTRGRPAMVTRDNALSETALMGPQDVYKMDVDGSGQTRLSYGKAIEAQPTWSPDGKKIAFTRQRFPGTLPHSHLAPLTQTTGIFTMDSDGTDPALVRIFHGQIASFPEWGVTAQQDIGAKQAVESEHTEEAIADWRALDARWRALDPRLPDGSTLP